MVISEIFRPLSQDVLVSVYKWCLGRHPTQSEYVWLRDNSNKGSPTNGMFAFDPNWNPGKKTLVVYCACHAIPLVGYYQRFFPEIAEQFNWVAIFAHVLKTEGLVGPYRDIFLPMFTKADAVVFTPMLRGQSVDPYELQREVGSPAQKWVGFHAPSFEALWPLCHIFGDQHIRDMLTAGKTPRDIKQGLADGTLDCQSIPRFQAAFDRMIHKDTECEIKIAPFFKRHFQRYRMFMSFNHPSFHVISYLGRRTGRGLLGMKTELTLEEENACLDGACSTEVPFHPIWPDHMITNRDLGLDYVDRVPDVPGFYEDWIDKIAAELRR